MLVILPDFQTFEAQLSCRHLETLTAMELDDEAT